MWQQNRFFIFWAGFPEKDIQSIHFLNLENRAGVFMLIG